MLLKIIQEFNAWSKLKIDIHLSKKSQTFYFKEGQIWWVSLGQNIGSEENGKNFHFERPVLILKKFNADMFLAVPTSSKIKPGNYRYIFQRNHLQYTINLSQMRVISAKRLLRRLGKLEAEDYKNIQNMFRKLV
ncbi:MAG: type II toxin-antitoxin system PemK/MazF family toxin [Patescibacteria group bacterium]|jgi:mRNA interferase MazF